MKTMITAFVLMISFAFSNSASAGIAHSQEPMDFGIVAGALFSKKSEVKVGKYKYNIISVDLGEPACNSVQVVVWVADDQLEGEVAGATYNLGLQVSGVVSVKAQGKKVVLKVKRNNPEDCTKSTIQTYTMEYAGQAGELNFETVKN